jgi:hypothetical protein
MPILYPSYWLRWIGSGAVYPQYPLSINSGSPYYSEGLVVADYSQLWLGIAVGGASLPVIALKWFDDTGLLSGCEECVETSGASSGGIQYVNLIPKRYGPLSTGHYSLWIPTAAFAVEIGVYATNDPFGTDTVDIVVTLSR